MTVWCLISDDMALIQGGSVNQALSGALMEIGSSKMTHALRFCSLAVTVGLALASPIAPAFAQEEMSPEQMQKALEQLSEMLKDADANEDGSTTKEEFAKHRGEMFSKLDRNEDGVINKSDVPKRGPVRKKKMKEAIAKVVPQYDTDLDGTVTRVEWNTQKRDPFELLDANGNGAIETDEIPTLPPAEDS